MGLRQLSAMDAKKQAWSLGERSRH